MNSIRQAFYALYQLKRANLLTIEHLTAIAEVNQDLFRALLHAWPLPYKGYWKAGDRVRIHAINDRVSRNAIRNNLTFNNNGQRKRR